MKEGIRKNRRLVRYLYQTKEAHYQLMNLLTSYVTNGLHQFYNKDLQGASLHNLVSDFFPISSASPDIVDISFFLEVSNIEEEPERAWFSSVEKW